MNNSEWAARLKTCFIAETGEKRGIQLPEPHQIAIDGEVGCVVIRMTNKGLLANMQKDEAAFEGWALVLHRWCGVEKIVLKWDLPSEGDSDRHYQRFLYRAKRFLELFPEWFKVP
jgi:hypothetical protein